jgi:nicotinate-nucleotide pyrophosphorylase (carboxylating)
MLSVAVIDEIVERTLLEDASGGDVTSECIVPAVARATARAVAKSAQVVCGLAVAERVFRRLDPECAFEALADEGESVEPGRELFVVVGQARALVVAERSALNLLQRMGGVATEARRFVDALPPDCTTRITDTRKTTPGLRALERYAVRTGGAHNHRDNLGSAVLIKDNHIAVAGGVARAIELAKQGAAHTMRIEVEVENLAMLTEALHSGADIVMLDNFAAAEIASAVQLVRGRALVEVSGNVGLDRVAELARAGVDVISVGALTHSVPAVDISLGFEPSGSAPRANA